MRTCIAVAVWLWLVGEAPAQPSSAAEVAFEKGRLLAKAELHGRACAAFELSQRLDPQFGTLFNLAGCYVSTGKIATAQSLYKELSRSDTNAERRSRAAELVAELEPRVSTVRVRVRVEQQSSDLRVFVGPTEVTSLLDVDIPFDAGRYVISAIRPGYLPFRRRITLDPKEVASVDVDLELEPELSWKPVMPERPPRKIGAKIMLATSAGLVVFGSGSIACWRWYVNDQVDAAMDSEASARAKRWATVAGFSLTLGAFGTVVGSVWLKSSGPRGVRLAPAVGSASASLVVSGAF